MSLFTKCFVFTELQDLEQILDTKLIGATVRLAKFLDNIFTTSSRKTLYRDLS